MATTTAGTVRAPEFPQDVEWFNSRPLSLADLRGKLVLLDFWTWLNQLSPRPPAVAGARTGVCRGTGRHRRPRRQVHGRNGL